MVLRSQRLRIIVRIIFIAIFIMLSVLAMNQERLYVATLVPVLIVILLLIELFRFIDRSNQEFINFLQSLKYQDFTKSYSRKFTEKTFRELESCYNEILAKYRDAKMEKELQFQYLQIVIDHIQAALLCFRQDGSIVLYNSAAGRLFQKPQPANIMSLKKANPELFPLLKKLRSGQRGLVKVYREGDLLQLAMLASEFRLKNEKYKLVSIQDIQPELEAQELDSWQKLIRVLTHEIMNSVTPVSSLSSAVNEMLVDEKGVKRAVAGLDHDDLEDMYSSLRTIEERSRGLLKFVGNYKHITKLPEPGFEDLDVNSLITRIQQLFKKELDSRKIRFSLIRSSGNLNICADRQMIEQVLINLVQNAIEAVRMKKEGQIGLSAYARLDKTFITVSDNGPGIDPENRDKIFVPFFTTKQKGSGIGLSLSRQIMRLHKGSIRFQSDHAGTTFILEF